MHEGRSMRFLRYPKSNISISRPPKSSGVPFTFFSYFPQAPVRSEHLMVSICHNHGSKHKQDVFLDLLHTIYDVSFFCNHYAIGLRPLVKSTLRFKVIAMFLPRH
jgi:hypothetical protein